MLEGDEASSSSDDGVVRFRDMRKGSLSTVDMGLAQRVAPSARALRDIIFGC